jgi:transcriptional antiterminator RfaH
VWTAVNTQAGREAIAVEHLARQGFETYSPQVSKRIRQGRRLVDAMRPMFPGYLFLQTSPDMSQWRPVLSTHGVRKVVRFGDQLGVIDPDFIVGLRAREVGGVVARPAEAFAIDQSVRISSGPFDGLIGTILKVSENERLVLLITLFQREMKVETNARAVHPLGAVS